MLLATWNLNNRVGKRKFRPETADAVIALNPDVMVFTEFFPQSHEVLFRRTLADAGWSNQLISREPPGDEIANRVLIAAKVPLEPLDVALPICDGQFPANLLCVRLPTCGISLVGARVPAYGTSPLTISAWDWLEQTAVSLRSTPAVMLGDLNVSMLCKRQTICAGAWLRSGNQSGVRERTPRCRRLVERGVDSL